jgi:hypothetical protein
VLAAYVDGARAIGVTGERLHDALELLVHEQVPVRLAASVLHDVLRLADPSVSANGCPHAADTAPVAGPHWCRLHGHSF